MIISKTNSFLFFELPRTGTTSIREVLLSEDIGVTAPVRRHVSISAYKLRHSLPDGFRIVSCVRHPMDRALSLYLKMTIDKNQYFTRLGKVEKKTYHQKRLYRIYRDVIDNELSFEKYFDKYLGRPYTDWMYSDYRQCDLIIRFENLASDYAEFCKLVRIDVVGELPIRNKIEGKQNYLDHYTPAIRAKAQRMYSVYMEKFGYKFPEDWPEYKITWWDRLKFLGVNMVYRIVNLFEI